LEIPGDVNGGAAVSLITVKGGGVFDWAMVVKPIAITMAIVSTAINPLVIDLDILFLDIEVTGKLRVRVI
jgi:hypothetical protein